MLSIQSMLIVIIKSGALLGDVKAAMRMMKMWMRRRRRDHSFY